MIICPIQVTLGVLVMSWISYRKDVQERQDVKCLPSNYMTPQFQNVPRIYNHSYEQATSASNWKVNMALISERFTVYDVLYYA